MTSTFLSAFPGHWRRPADDYRDAIKTSLIVLDTNILLGLYRFTPAARSELFDVLSKVEDRLWVPNQVVDEYYQRRIDAVKEHIDLYNEVPKAISDHKAKILSEIRNFANRCSLSGPDKNELIDPVEASIKDVLEKIKIHEEKFDLTLEKVVNADPILSALAQLLDGKTGDPFSAEEKESLLKEFSNRVETKTPPGYRDAGKKENAHGDYFIWEQVIRESKARNMPILMVTNDAKEDWIRREAGLIVGARPELIEEMKSRADTELLITQLGLFLKSAKAELGASVSPSTVAQAESLRSKSPSAARRLRVGVYIHPQLVRELGDLLNASTAEVNKLERFLSSKEIESHDLIALRTILQKELKRREFLSTSLFCVRENIVSETKLDYIIGFPDEVSFEQARSALHALRRRARHMLHTGRAEIRNTEGEDPAIREQINSLLISKGFAHEQMERLNAVTMEAHHRAREGDPKGYEEYTAAREELTSSEVALANIEEQLRELIARMEGDRES
ncbi:hypothetical protein GA0115240_167010 [Streptomyces sp. DvalAA-14]|uniref:PIN-like domain-containing protein n=1 Tax=unclassified Streptomyces TaxID=2593676 RepID=UPI00081B0CEE|nr:MULTISPECIES: PIN domain-containing protein [unclassified Streptomyces]MYS24669.1 DUF4935 domain-containing protein [Streptomyces sp. SID4948]SCE48263.1 hypothetical protein GA0115240_167010 [Streptomyces sp. DvalAA-14]